MMNYEIKRINVWSVIKIVFLISFCIGALVAVFYALLISLVSTIIQNISPEAFDTSFGSLRGIGLFFLIIMFALFIAVSNTILTALFICAYNLMAQWFGGFKIELKSSQVSESIETYEASSSVSNLDKERNNWNETGG